ncbi:hypothetical protein H310_10193 [Aphanomyces invadans]|uniref:Enoyl reductase (ER) domain-containing protein n=1 Tax=Aphanomyces invadans TaxID=157072 RepID=A0A024TR34_9STRA|nr:hypothetical protein H310_10193 [Aphanomyces invadans]ETV96439.1 hypothetical protein H310_10193 [Aphanomyces invadans]|eukprot:XP_008874702.1 hypothetical protein H310_10193 [Aphanomyces invadans]
MASNDIYHGQAAFAPGLEVGPHEYAAMPFDEEYGVEIKVTHCGICGSDLHTITGGWGTVKYPLVVGHEIIGHVTRVGSKVDQTKYAIGARAGVGAQCGSCLDCKQCHNQLENLCDNGPIFTYNSKTSQGYVTQGGYADYYRCHYNAAPMMCAGVTTYAPLKHHGAGPGKHVGVVGIGGLGHLGVQWAVALGAEVTAVSSSSRKEKDAKELLGAHHFVNYNDVNAAQAAAKSFDILLVTSYSKDTNWNALLALVATNGKLVLVGLPETPISFFPFSVVSRQVTFVGSCIGSPAELEEMLAFAVEKGVNSIVQVMPMSQATEALHKVRDGSAHFRIVLKHE